MTVKRVLSVGQCSADHGKITRSLQSFPVEIVAAATTDEALAVLRQESFALVLVNRVFDADGDSGLEFIKAVAAGAIAGFGKAALNGPVVTERIRPYLELS
jgi:ActR/RegA family two-component response regulator